MPEIGLVLLGIVSALGACYLASFIWMWTRQERYLFKPKHYEVNPAFEKFRWDQTVRGAHLQGWFLDKGTEKTVIYYGGNAEDLAGHCDVLFQGLETNVLLVNYRGYGQSEGTPTETDMVADCIELFDRFCEQKKVDAASIYLMGRSLGSGVAVQVAAARPQAAGAILVTPYEDIAAIARFQYPWLPLPRVLRHPFRSIDYAQNITMPALVLLAEFDEIIPVESGRRLGEVWGGPSEIITLPMGHMNINEQPGYFEAINRFVGQE